MTTAQKIQLPRLKDGDRLDQQTFHARYEAMPRSVRAELIGGIVYIASPMKTRHGRHGSRFNHWLTEYELSTPGTETLENTTGILGPQSEPQPDSCLIILPELGGQTWVDEDGYLNGAPEWVGEISDASEAVDLHAKKKEYEKAGVKEYVVVALKTNQVHWFVRRRAKFKDLAADADGIFRSEVFPGLWLDAAALLRREGKQVLAVLRQGLASAEHADFVAKLARRGS